MILLNPTNEEISVTFHGLPLVFKAGEKLKVKDSVGRQVIHNYENRGIVSLEYGDEGAGEMEKAEIGKEKNKVFKTKQCINYNQINDRRKQSGQPFIDPSAQIKEYDKELIKNRILLALDWERLNSLLINLLNHYELDQEKLGFDFKTLIKIRNDIAHSGQFRKKYSKRDLIDLINNNKLGLQIVLLKELGYDGIIVCKIDKRETKIKIDELIKVE